MSLISKLVFDISKSPLKCLQIFLRHHGQCAILIQKYKTSMRALFSVIATSEKWTESNFFSHFLKKNKIKPQKCKPRNLCKHPYQKYLEAKSLEKPSSNQRITGRPSTSWKELPEDQAHLVLKANTLEPYGLNIREDL